MKHYRNGSSTAYRDTNCPGWHNESEGIPRIESAAATDGTIVHGINEMRALGNPDPDIVEGHKVEEDHIKTADAMWAARNATHAKYDVVDYEPEVTGKMEKDVGGTIDEIMIARDGTIILGDYKTGRGVQVDAVGNSQILFCAGAAIKDSCLSDDLAKAEKFIGVIWQPDIHGDVQTKEWEFTRQQVDDFWEHHTKMIAMTREHNAPLKSGSWCRFCPAAPFCPEKNGQAQAALRMDPTDLTTLAEALDMCAELDQWVKDVKKTAMEQLESGATIKGWKLKPRRATEAWLDVEGALKKLRRYVGGKKGFMVEKPITPAAARKALVAKGVAKDVADEMVSGYTERKSSGMNLAQASDDSPDVSPAAIASAIRGLE